MDVKLARYALKMYRRCATQLQTFLERYKATVDKCPEVEAELMASGLYHKRASHWIASILAKTSEKDIEKENLQYSRTLKEEEWTEILKEHFSPFGVLQEVIMPLAMYGLKDYEELFIQNYWKLPKWKRPVWLKEMEVNYESSTLC